MCCRFVNISYFGLTFLQYTLNILYFRNVVFFGLFLGIFYTTPIIDIHMILFGLDKSTLKVYKKKLFILHNYYIKNLSIFLAPPKKAWMLCGCFLREESSETQNSKRFRFSMSNFYAKIIKWRLSKKNFEK